VSEERHPAQTRAVQHAQLARQAERMARYEHIVALQKQGVKIAEIALQLGVTQRTIQRWIATENIPYSRPRRQRPRLIDPYKTYLLKRWHQGCRKGAQLERELRAKGYKGSGRAMYRYLQTLEPTDFSARERGSVSAMSQPNPLLALSTQQATWLFFRKEEDLRIRRAADASTVETGKPAPGNRLSASKRVSAHGG
jgi:excisionase family DNA binding protein